MFKKKVNVNIFFIHMIHSSLLIFSIYHQMIKVCTAEEEDEDFGDFMGPDAGIGDVEGLSTNPSFPRLTEALGETQSVARYFTPISCVCFLLYIRSSFIYICVCFLLYIRSCFIYICVCVVGVLTYSFCSLTFQKEESCYYG